MSESVAFNELAQDRPTLFGEARVTGAAPFPTISFDLFHHAQSLHSA
jgi:hypothetical protein